MTSDLQQRKTALVFTAMDADNDGYLERADFEALTDRWTTIRGQAGSARLREIMMGWWDALRAMCDADGDQRVTLAEVWSVVDNLGSMLDRVAATADSMFEAVDEDGDGRVTAAEYARMIRAWTGRATPTDAAFARLDTDGDGFVSRSEFTAHWVEFWAGDDEDAPGTHLFGELGVDA
ncbi:EF-hand domain-containing protein [Actinokineospora auranticolor]|uniref:Ca2+-binding EF-hand superfamily protein n=1 Tax=Actinokineospora auranticolor TaxID=155976 RepID=A0A2S6GD68_9PSEU|nr:EF-hand domain-containing protein [Actinokineospora auranticolor]PPK63194.1 Ca2+-binding EF-hand superfamily protein [Actinokineospora auranticolor]